MLTACVPLQSQVKSTIESQFPSNETIYESLDQNSYGELSMEVDEVTQKIIPPSLCDEESSKSGLGNDKADLGRKITKFLFKTMEDSCKVDEVLEKEDLKNHFLMPGDPTSGPLVSILDRSENNILFWYCASLVKFDEVEKAAKDYCSRLNKTLIYEGSARKCSKPQKNIFKGQKTETYVISSFQCTPITIASSSSIEPEKNKNNDLVKNIQNELIRLNYLLNGEADGVMGKKTKAAIVEFQSKNNIPADGLATESLLSVLKANN